MSGVAENVTVVPKSTTAAEAGLGRSERFLTLRETSAVVDVLGQEWLYAQPDGPRHRYAAERPVLEDAAGRAHPAAHPVRSARATPPVWCPIG